MVLQLPLGPRVRKSPYFDATVEAGLASATVYNHMYMPTGYGDPMAEYWRLIQGVAMWDVAVQRQVEISGPDAAALAQAEAELGDHPLDAAAMGPLKNASTRASAVPARETWRRGLSQRRTAISSSR